MNLHGKIMNLPIQADISDRPAVLVQAFKRGHKDARHAAAEMLIEYDHMCNGVAFALEQLLEDYKDACLDWTPENQERGQELIAQAESALSKFMDLE